MKFLFFIIPFFFAPLETASQESFTDVFKYKGIYQLTYQPDSTDASSVTSEEMWLYLGDEISQFSSKGRAIEESLAGNGNMFNGGFVNFEARAEMTRTEFGYIIYKDFPEDKISYTLQILEDKLRYEEDKDLLHWEILPETKTIQGYKTQKAKTEFRGRVYTAWFTPEIPISDGPYKFSGLPGLILQLKDNNEHYLFELVSFENLEEPISFKMSTEDFVITTKEKLLQQKRQYEEDPFAALERNNQTSTRKVTIHMTKKQKKEQLDRIREELEKKNNPIELE